MEVEEFPSHMRSARGLDDAAGAIKITNHTFRATGITKYLAAGGKIEVHS